MSPAPHTNVFNERRGELAGSRGFLVGLIAAVAFHAVLLVGLAWLDAKEVPHPKEYAAVRIVPMAELPGRRSNPPAAPAQPKTEPKQAATQPEPTRKDVPSPPKPDSKKPPEIPTANPTRAERPEPPSSDSPSPAAGTDAPSPTPGSPFGLSALEGIDPDFTYDYYLEQMLSLIRRQWVRPEVEGRISAAVRFTVLKSGEISDLELAEPSGFNAFDLAALRAVQNATPLPRLPASYRKGELRVTLFVR